MNLEPWWRRLGRGVRLFEDWLLVAMLGLMILLAGWQIIQRNLYGSALVWADELLRILVLWLGLMGALVASRDDRHISIDILTRFLPQKLKRLACLLVHSFASVVCALLAWHAGRFVLLEREFHSVLLGGLPAWPFELILPFGFGLIGCRYLMHVIDGCRTLQESETP